MTDPFSAAIIAAVNFVVTTAATNQFVQFVGATLLTQALTPDQPKLSDLRIQTSAYGAPIPRVYGTTVRVAGNIIDKSDLIPIKHNTLGGIGPSHYTYYAHVAVLLSEGGLIQPGGLKRIWANGRVIFDRDRDGATPGTANFRGVQDAFGWTRLNNTMAHIGTLTLYPGTATQGVDPTLQALHPGEDYPAYRHSCYAMLERFDLADWGNRVPNLEFEIEPVITRLGDIVDDMASFAGVNVYTNRLTDTVRGFIVASDGSVWSALEPLAATFAFDLIETQARFEAVRRGRYMRTIIAAGDMGAIDVKDQAKPTKEVDTADPNKLPDEVTVTYLDVQRDYQPNTQRAARGEGYSTNKINAEVAIVLTPDEAADVANRTLQEALARGKTLSFTLAEKYRWLRASDVVGVPIGGVIEPVRLLSMTRSPNGVIECEAVYEDPYIYRGGLTGSAGNNFPTGEILLPGDTIMQPMDAAILRDTDDDTGFYMAFAGSEAGWHGATFSRAAGIGSPLTFELIGDVGPIPAIIGDCQTVLPNGPTDVWDELSTLTVDFPGITPQSATEDDVLIRGKNLAWVGNPDGHDGEYIHFREAVAGSPEGTYVLSGLLRGRYGTEYAVAAHGSGERVVVVSESDRIERFNFGPADWNLARTYRGVSLPLEDGQTIEFTNTGEGKRPLSGVHLNGSRDTSNNLTVTWDRRTRFQTGDVAAAVPLGEELETYEVDIMGGSPLTALRTIAATTAQISYAATEQTADGLTPGDLVQVEVYQVSTIRGRGRVLSGTV